ncbi:DNA-directed RNA polymerase sigma-70 factor [Azorhizobium oxalatiphilum]|uniref:DNA-directed RNA polymerase sigma-70 factor n=1 Tax=Azorhizobium oxalatiphilum TaxID=980631 RepID=A0A917FEZ4_9HYPH|nr:sigma-70 family RNA polymerase sigma factor [Azorhizobium oxalatiphilum]GGF71535.1 DNA-directed RNA polymerase sigma-70 factor [Azorhizobium oxalatiphilum]
MQASLADIFLSNRKSLIWSVMRIVRDAQIAEDLAQETYIRARKAIENGPIEHVEAFLHQTARNLALNHKRRDTMRGRIEREDLSEDQVANIASASPSQESQLIHRERLNAVHAAIAKLPQRAQTVWLLSRIEKWPYPRIAEHLGVSPNTVFNDLKLAHACCVEALARIDRG